jgi:dTDP-glucose 4,6-dehydratase
MDIPLPDASAKTILVTGGLGFIGSHLVECLIGSGYHVINLDLQTYAGNPENLTNVGHPERYKFIHGNIGDRALVLNLLAEHRPSVVFNLAAESHVDRSIEDGTDFISTNVVALHQLLGATLTYWQTLSKSDKISFRFIQMSTDEVYGSIAEGEFTENSSYAPNSPYAASKAAGDHLVRAFNVTYGLPTLIARASNTYGPRQYPEKLIPHTIASALNKNPLPVYGHGENVRDWMFVSDLVRGLVCVVYRGLPGEIYNFSGGQMLKNIDTVRKICAHLDLMIPEPSTHDAAIAFVDDRPGHDFRYAMSSKKVQQIFGWQPRVEFEEGLRITINWYLANDRWWETVYERGYRGVRLGLGLK